MGTRLDRLLFTAIGDVRYQPTQKRVRALAGDDALVDSTGAVLVWEPRRVVPSYAVPLADVHAELVPSARAADVERPVPVGRGGPPVLDPRTGFGAHSCPGESLTLVSGDRRLEGAAFRPDDPDLHHLVVLDFAAFDEWREEDETIASHPRDPFHRVDVRRSDRHVVVALDGTTLADTRAPRLVFETHLPTRYYLPREDVRTDLLDPSPTRTACAYKGEASYWSSGGDDLAWYYERPLPDAAELVGTVAFFDERVDVTVDGVGQECPESPWS